MLQTSCVEPFLTSFLQDVFYNGTLDGVDLQELNRTYVSLTRRQTITESKHFLDKVLIDESSNLKSDYLNVEGTVKGLNLSDIASRAFISGNAGQEIDGTLTFTENVTFLGLSFRIFQKHKVMKISIASSPYYWNWLDLKQNPTLQMSPFYKHLLWIITVGLQNLWFLTIEPEQIQLQWIVLIIMPTPASNDR